MKPVPVHLRNELANRFDYDPTHLKKLGGGHDSSDGITYSIDRDGLLHVFKIVGKNALDPDAEFGLRTRAAFFAYLGENGVDVVSPVPNRAGNLIESIEQDNDQFIAYTYPMLTGVHPSPEQWTDDVLISWGKVIGLSHRLTMAYPIWEGVVSPNTGKMTLTWQAEVDSFTSWCADEDGKAYWARLKDELSALAQTRATSGFIHNDPHMQNILIDGNTVKLLDFDVASCHFFACDLAIAIQSVLFTASGGMDRPVSDADALDRFVTRLLDGYRMEMDPPADLLDQIDLFIRYRRALLFTVMQDWLSTNPEAFDAWKSRLLAGEKLL